MRAMPVHSRSRLGLRREIAAALAVKLVLLAAIYFLFFAPAARPHLDGGVVARTILDAATPATQNEGAR